MSEPACEAEKHALHTMYVIPKGTCCSDLRGSLLDTTLSPHGSLCVTPLQRGRLPTSLCDNSRGMVRGLERVAEEIKKLYSLQGILIKLDKLIVLSKSSLLGWLLQVSLIVIIKDGSLTALIVITSGMRRIAQYSNPIPMPNGDTQGVSQHFFKFHTVTDLLDTTLPP